MSINDPQPPPKPSEGLAIWDSVIEDMRERDKMGLLKYGYRLTANNGRKPLIDGYQEALDMAVYLKQAIYEAEQKDHLIADLLASCNQMRREWGAFGTLSQETIRQAEDAICRAEGR